MAWKCEDCKWENADKWPACANCGKPSGLPPKIETREDKIFKYLAISLLVIFFILVFVLLDTLTEMYPPQPTQIEVLYDEKFAYIACLGFLEKHLNVSIGDIASRSDSLVYQESEYYFQVHTYVFYRTSFGSKIKSAAYCRVMYSPERGEWGLLEISD